MLWPFGRRDAHRDQVVEARLAALGESIASARATVDAQAPRVAVVSGHAHRAADRRAEEIRRNHLDQLYIRDMQSQVSRGDHHE